MKIKSSYGNDCTYDKTMLRAVSVENNNHHYLTLHNLKTKSDTMETYNVLRE